LRKPETSIGLITPPLIHWHLNRVLKESVIVVLPPRHIPQLKSQQLCKGPPLLQPMNWKGWS
jgi:hypothetical protein